MLRASRRAAVKQSQKEVAVPFFDDPPGVEERKANRVRRKVQSYSITDSPQQQKRKELELVEPRRVRARRAVR